MKYSIKELFEEHRIDKRDQKVLDQITNYLSNNHDAMLDGIFKKFVIFGSTNETRITNLYNISNSEWSKFKSKHKTLHKDFKVSGSLLRMALANSYYTTGERLFLDFMAVTIYGSRWSIYFRHGVKEHVMKYVVDKKLNMKSYFKKYGSSFVVVQNVISSIVNGEDSTASEKKKIAEVLKDDNDDNMIYLVNSIYTRINSVLNILANHYYAAEKEEKNGYVLSVSDEAEEGKLSLSNNSLRISNLKSLIDNDTSTTLDDSILKTLRIDSSLKRGCFNSILGDKQADIFRRYAGIYIDYYIKINGNDWNNMKRNFINKSNSARMKEPDAKLLDDTITKMIREYVKKYTKLSKVDPEDLKTSNGVVKLTRRIKDYIIIRIRYLMNQID